MEPLQLLSRSADDWASLAAWSADKSLSGLGSQCDVHHVQFHSQGGSSNADNAVVLCSEHHHLLHQSPFRIEMHHGTPLAPRWLNPKQTWKPLSHPKHRLRTPNHSNTDFNESDHSDYSSY
jgi:hypothetical protein